MYLAGQQQLLDLHQQLQNKELSILARDATIEQLREQLALLLSKRYQSQSEQLRHLQGQLFDEAELEDEIREIETALANIEPSKAAGDGVAKKKEKPRRKPLPIHPKRVDILLEVSP